MLVDSLEIVVLSVDPDHVFVEGCIIRNEVFVSLVYFSEMNRRTEA